MGNEVIFLHLKGHAASQAVADYPVNRLSGFDEIVIGLVCLLVALGFASVSPRRYLSEIVPPISASNGPLYVLSSRIRIVIDALCSLVVIGLVEALLVLCEAGSVGMPKALFNSLVC